MLADKAQRTPEQDAPVEFAQGGAMTKDVVVGGLDFFNNAQSALDNLPA